MAKTVVLVEKGLEGTWRGDVFTIFEELVWKLSLTLRAGAAGKLTGEGTLTDANDEENQHELAFEGRVSKETKSKPREVLLRMHGSHGWTWLLVLDLDDAGKTLAGKGLLLEDAEGKVTFAQLVKGALIAGQLGEKPASSATSGALEWVDPGRFALEKVGVSSAKKSTRAARST